MIDKPKLYEPTVLPLKRNPDDDYSIDVCIIDEHGMHGLAYYQFVDERWIFHTDTLVDYNEVGAETKWLWYYTVINVDDLKKYYAEK